MLYRVLLLVVLSLCSFCARAAKQIDLPMPLAQEMAVEIIESQPEAFVAVPATASEMGTPAGLVGIMIDEAVRNSRVKKGEKRVTPLRDLLVDYRFNQKMQASLRAKLPSEGISPHPLVTVLPTTWDAEEALQSSKLPPYALQLVPAYAFDNKFTQMTVSLQAQVLDRSVKANGEVKVVPRFSRTYVFQYLLQGARSADPVQDWAAIGAAGLAGLLDRGIEQTSEMVVHDFSAEGRAAWKAKSKPQPIYVVGTKFYGIPVRQGDGWAWIRMDGGGMQMILGVQPLQVGTLPVLPAPAAVTTSLQDEPAAATESAAPSDNTGAAPLPNEG